MNRSAAEVCSPIAEAWRRPVRTAAERAVRHADRIADEVRRLGDTFRAATGGGRHDRVLDVGCGGGECTRDAGRATVARRRLPAS